MKDKKEALELRKLKKSKKPVFLKQDAHKKAKLKNNWRQPKGRQSKMRLKKKGYRKQPSVGYSSPRLVRGLNPQGLREVHVFNLEDLSKVQPGDGIVIGSTVGVRKKLEILKKVKELKDLNVINVKDVDAFIKSVEDKLLAKKKESKERAEKKKKLKEEAIKRAEEKKKEEEKKTEEEKKEELEEIKKQKERQKSMQQPI